MQFAVVKLGPVQTTMNVNSEVLNLTRRKASISVSELQEGNTSIATRIARPDWVHQLWRRLRFLAWLYLSYTYLKLPFHLHNYQILFKKRYGKAPNQYNPSLAE